jgi:hypothetical protein
MVEKSKYKIGLEFSTKSFDVLEHLKDSRDFDELHLEALKLRAKIFLLSGDFEGAKKPLMEACRKRLPRNSEDLNDVRSHLKSVIR